SAVELKAAAHAAAATAILIDFSISVSLPRHRLWPSDSHGCDAFLCDLERVPFTSVSSAIIGSRINDNLVRARAPATAACGFWTCCRDRRKAVRQGYDRTHSQRIRGTTTVPLGRASSASQEVQARE